MADRSEWLEGLAALLADGSSAKSLGKRPSRPPNPTRARPTSKESRHVSNAMVHHQGRGSFAPRPRSWKPPEGAAREVAALNGVDGCAFWRFASEQRAAGAGSIGRYRREPRRRPAAAVAEKSSSTAAALAANDRRAGERRWTRIAVLHQLP